MSRRAVTFLAGGGVAGVAAVLAGQAGYCTHRRDLPRAGDLDASGREPAPAGAARRVVLAAGGDSTLTGPGLADPGQIWVRQLARAIAARDAIDVEVRSVAVQGARVRDVLHRQLDGLLAAPADVVVLAVGTNDAVHHTPLDRVARDLDALLAKLVPAVPAVVVGGVGDLAAIARVPFPLSAVLAGRGRRVDRVIRAAAAAHGVHYIDVSSVDRAFHRGGAALYTADRYHPNEHGHALWAHAARPVVAHALRTCVGGDESGRSG